VVGGCGYWRGGAPARYREDGLRFTKNSTRNFDVVGEKGLKDVVLARALRHPEGRR
jgi:hypothetical protein